jgi:hypothetical protein
VGSKRSWKLAGLALAAVAAGFLVLGGPGPDTSRPGGNSPPVAAGASQAGAGGGSPTGVAGASPPGPATGGPPPTGAAATPPAPPHDSSGVTAAEDLAAGQAERAMRIAEEFARRWSTPDPRWHARLRELSTPDLADALAGAEPLQPAPRFTGPGIAVFHNPDWARVVVPADRGELVLDLIRDSGDSGWLVTAVGWRRS